MKKVFHSFAELGSYKGITANAQRPATKRCFKCGGLMTQIPGTNVFVCTGKDEKGNPCNNRAVSHA